MGVAPSGGVSLHKAVSGALLYVGVKLMCRVCLLSSQVEGLSAEVAAFKGQQGQPDGATGVQEQLNKLSASMEKRHSRVETAIYQVRLLRAGINKTSAA